MRSPLLIAVPAFLIGCLVTGTLTSTARAQSSPENYGGLIVRTSGAVAAQTGKGSKVLPMYRIVVTEADLNKYAAQGYAVQNVVGDHLGAQYLMQRTR